MQNLCINNLSLITKQNEEIDISGTLIPKYNETTNKYIYYENIRNNELKWCLINDKWIYKDSDFILLICETINIEIPLLCSNWSYKINGYSSSSKWIFEIGNCSNISNKIYNFNPDPLHNDTMITLILFCTVFCLLITVILVFKLYHHIKQDLKYHITQRDEIQHGITNNNDDDDDDDIDIINDNKMEQQQAILIDDEDLNEDKDESLYEEQIMDKTEITSPGMEVTTNDGFKSDGFKLPIPYYRSDRTTLISLDGQEGANSVKLWIMTKVNIPSSNDKYMKLLLQHGYETLDIIRTIKRDDLEAIGIYKRGHQSKILSEVDKLNKM